MLISADYWDPSFIVAMNEPSYNRRGRFSAAFIGRIWIITYHNSDSLRLPCWCRFHAAPFPVLRVFMFPSTDILTQTNVSNRKIPNSFVPTLHTISVVFHRQVSERLTTSINDVSQNSDLYSHTPTPSPPKSKVPPQTGRNSWVNFFNIIHYPPNPPV